MTVTSPTEICGVGEVGESSSRIVTVPVLRATRVLEELLSRTTENVLLDDATLFALIVIGTRLETTPGRNVSFFAATPV